MAESSQDEAKFIELERRQALQQRKSRLWSALLGATAIFGLVMAASALYQWQLALEGRLIAERAAAEAEFSRELSNYEAHQRHLLGQFVESFSNAPGTIAVSPGGDLVAFTDSFGDLATIPNSVTVVVSSDSGQTYQLQTRFDGLDAIAIDFLPDGSGIAIADSEGNLRIVDALTGAELLRAVTESPLRSFSVSADGQLIFLQQTNGEIAKLDRASGMLTSVWP